MFIIPLLFCILPDEPIEITLERKEVIVDLDGWRIDFTDSQRFLYHPSLGAFLVLNKDRADAIMLGPSGEPTDQWARWIIFELRERGWCTIMIRHGIVIGATDFSNLPPIEPAS